MTQAAVAQLSVPVIAAVGAVLTLGETLSTRLVLAGVAVLSGVGLVLSAADARLTAAPTPSFAVRAQPAPPHPRNPMILVVGATGMLGLEICRRLREQGRAVRALVRPGSPKESLLREIGVEIHHGDLRTPSDGRPRVRRRRDRRLHRDRDGLEGSGRSRCAPSTATASSRSSSSRVCAA